MDFVPEGLPTPSYPTFISSQPTNLLFPLYLHADLEPDGTGYGRLVAPLLKMVPHVHLPREGPHLDDGLTEEVVRLPCQLLSQSSLEVVVLVPDSHFDPVARVVTFAASQLVSGK